MNKQHKAAIEATGEHLGALIKTDGITDVGLMKGCVAFMVAQNVAHKETATVRSLKPYYKISVLLSTGETARRSVYEQYQICAKLADLPTDDPKGVLADANAKGLIRKTSKGYVGLPESFSDGTRTKAEPPTAAI
jgi:hypothetical protein